MTVEYSPQVTGKAAVFNASRGAWIPWTLITAGLLVGCGSAPPKGPEAAPASVSLQEYLQQASQAAASGSREKTRQIHREAAKAHPASHVPWLKLAEDYFEAGDYGNAILAAQEVLLREANDSVAASVLAVSGLRVSATALQTLRAQNRIAAGTRTEAQTMARTLRDILGETVLVPLPQPAPSPASAAAPIRPRPRAVVAPPPPASAPRTVVAPPTGSSNPFDKLK